MLHPKAVKQYSDFGYFPNAINYYPEEFGARISYLLNEIKKHRKEKIYVTFYPFAESLNHLVHQDDSLIFWNPVFSEKKPDVLLIHESIHGIGAADRIFLDKFYSNENLTNKLLIDSPKDTHNSLRILFGKDLAISEPNLYQRLMAY
jgi:hypothetical protein